MAGSIMALILYEGKYYLHTGDMRFNETVAENLPDLFSKSVSPFDSNISDYHCRYQIEKLYLDNTFCDPIFMFPPRVTLINKIVIRPQTCHKDHRRVQTLQSLHMHRFCRKGGGFCVFK